MAVMVLETSDEVLLCGSESLQCTMGCLRWNCPFLFAIYLRAVVLAMCCRFNNVTTVVFSTSNYFETACALK
jgi:hypothetical protein